MTPTASTAFTTAADEFVIQLAQERGLLRPAQIDAARSLLPSEPGAVGAPRLLDVLIQQGALSSRRVAELLADEFGMAMAPDLAGIRITGDTLELVPRAVAARHRLLPLGREGNRLKVAISDPLDTDGIDALGYLVKMPLDTVVATPEEISAAIDRF